MIAVLERFDQVTAAGILARAALSIDGNPAGGYRLPDEARIRQAVIEEALRSRGFNPHDRRPEALAELGDILDSEIDSLVPTVNQTAALERLAERGDLPPDLFEVEVIKNISDFHGYHFPAEQALIEATVRSPDQEQHYGAHPTERDAPFLISLFAKFFPDRYPGRSFTMLVAGQRVGMKLVVHQAWRIYPTDVDISGAKALVDVLKGFAEIFGVNQEVGSTKGKFILTTDLGGRSDLEGSWQNAEGETDKKGRREISVSFFYQQAVKGPLQAALVVAIDLVKYRRYLESHGY